MEKSLQISKQQRQEDNLTLAIELVRSGSSKEE